MSVYREFADFIRERGDLIGRVHSFKGDKLIYLYGDHIILIDTAPKKPKDLIVTIMAKRGERRDGELIYVSPAAKRGSEFITGTDVYEGVPSSPEALEGS